MMKISRKKDGQKEGIMNKILHKNFISFAIMVLFFLKIFFLFKDTKHAAVLCHLVLEQVT